MVLIVHKCSNRVSIEQWGTGFQNGDNDDENAVATSVPVPNRRNPGICYYLDGWLSCMETHPCEDLKMGDSCSCISGPPGTCDAIDDVLFCKDESWESSALLDGMTADICGNIYVCEMNGIIWRITPDGKKERVASVMDGCAAVNFGSGVGIWKRDHLYVGGFSQGLTEFPVGIEGKWEPHLP